MLKTLKKTILSTLSILGISLTSWVILILNPSLSYAHETHFEHVTVHHNQNLEEQTARVIKDAIDILKNSALFTDDILIELCINDDKLYPFLNPLVGQTTAYALLNKAVFKNGKPIFSKNVVEAKWPINNNELRKFNLTWLLAHEFTHNLQNTTNLDYIIKSTLGHINWKLEGHAEYIARGFKNDDLLKTKIDQYIKEEKLEHPGFPVFELEDGTKQILSYYKYALAVQYLMEEKNLNYIQICALDQSLEEVYSEMLEWKKGSHDK